ncbi:molybdopterin molybdotransferase MoeA [Neomoorella thermoacetica]|uniref:molybdopterin molybdotransferase MoeA n=1 Tax=Neomoorella thermoacetica TaxID=1525 RepID=UPI0008FB2A2C|nr:molybdopterin molybdotransferase MoeA [Moorella thermoacetica]OIQ55025.1 molybdopterin molybdenumtransferase [Moorella thermoacetica]
MAGVNASFSLEEGRELLLAGLKPTGRVKIKLAEAPGRILAEPVVAPRSFPPFPRSRVDGYALGLPPAGREVPAGGASGKIYRLVATVAAGSCPAVTLGPGTAAAIFTGARLPEGTMTVIPRELAERQGDLVIVPELPPGGSFMEATGSEVAAGERVLAAGTELGPAEIGLLAALGLTEITVYRSPRAVLASSGSELVELPGLRGGCPGGRQAGGEAISPVASQVQALGPRIYNSNFYALAAAASRDGARVIPLGPLADELEEQVEAYRKALEEGDVLLTTGGAGGSIRDLTAAAFTGAGGEILFTTIRMRPGRRVIAARRGDKLLLGLPGNPPAALVAYYLLAAPVIRALGGREVLPATFPAVLTAAIDKPRPERAFIWARAWPGTTGWQVAPLPRRPGGIRAAIGANALIDLPAGPAPGAGEEVRVVLLSAGGSQYGLPDNK